MRPRRLAALAVALTACTTAAQAETMLVTADRMLDVRTGRYVEQPWISVQDGMIVAMGRRGQGPAAPTVVDRRVDLPG
jgi:imidazolonepropionase-like amidohydrolase